MDRTEQKQPKTDRVENLPEQEKGAPDQQQPTPEQAERVKGGKAEQQPPWFKRA